MYLLQQAAQEHKVLNALYPHYFLELCLQLAAVRDELAKGKLDYWVL